jgi:serine phosphatase RsbU (regulator of sigma subunit)
LAIINNKELMDMKKIFINETIVLEKGSKLVLYTDGLTEAENINNDTMSGIINFESTLLEGSFRTHFAKSSELFIQGVYKDLIDFRGGDNFEDDVCIICMDVQ